jgi:hypothetical protein
MRRTYNLEVGEKMERLFKGSDFSKYPFDGIGRAKNEKGVF